MGVENEGLMAAIDSGIAEASSTPTPAPAPAAPTGGTDEPVDTQGAADPAPALVGDGDDAGKAGDEADVGGDEPADGEPDGGNGLPADGDKPDVDPAKAGVDAAADPEAGKAADPLNDPLPNALKRETKDRIKTLITMVKEKTERLEHVESAHTEVMGYIRDTKATPEQYSQALNYLRVVNTGSREEKEQLLDFMQREVMALARMVGKPIPGVNMLEGHDDLIAKVGSGKLSPEDAQEIAAAREARDFDRRSGEATRQHNDAQARAQQAVNAGKQQLNALEAQLKSDPNYAAKKAILVKSLRPVFAQIPPNQWAATFQRAYNELTVPAAPSVPSSQPAPTPKAPANGGGGGTPLRAGNPAGSTVQQPKSLQEAIDLGIASAGH